MKFTMGVTVHGNSLKALADQLRRTANQLNPPVEQIIDAEVVSELTAADLTELPTHSHVTTEGGDTKRFRVWLKTVTGFWRAVDAYDTESHKLVGEYGPVYLLALGKS